MKALMWIVRVLLALVMAVLIFASGMLLFSSSVKKEDPPSLLGYAPFTVSNGEMTPSLYPGDLAILRLGPESQPGDIVAFRKEGALVLRRVVGTSEEYYITQQEAFGQPDVDLLDPAQVEAVCVTYLPGCGAAAAFLYSPIGLAVLVVLALAIVVVPMLFTGGTAKLEGPLVDYGQQEEYEAPAPRQAAPAARGGHKWYKDLDDYDDDEDTPYTPPRQAASRQAQRPEVRQGSPRAVRQEPRPAPRREAPPTQPDTSPRQERPARRGGSHYKPRH